jgi:hypothetical protein
MNPRLASFLAIAFCVFVFAVVALFGYTRYRVAQRENAAFQRQIIQEEQRPTELKARMPSQLGTHASSVSAGSAATPDSNGSQP